MLVPSSLLSRRSCLIALSAAGTLLRPPTAARATPLASAQQQGRQFLVSLLDPELNLLPEFRGSNTYWLFHDNYLAAAALKSSHPEIAAQLRQAWRGFGVDYSGKIEIILNEARDPLPFRHHELIEVAQRGDKVIKTERLTDRPLMGWEAYADLLLLASLALRLSDPKASRMHLQTALALWDGRGFRDRVVEVHQQYATYKLALGLLATSEELTHELRPALLERLLTMQRRDGGWITDYDRAGKPLGEANVETTSLALLALDTFHAR
jgi:hypothetical protein